jgi:hypothetical protein
MHRRFGFTVAVLLVALTVLRWPCGPACAPDAHANRAPSCHGDSSAIATLAAATHDCRDHAAGPAVVSSTARLIDLVAAPPVVAIASASSLTVGVAILHTSRSHAPPPPAARSLPLRI